ncbi:uncharacterized protein A1O9_02742, partial [Exophiala aquamarina CBS 119918]
MNDREHHVRSTDPKVRSACDRCRNQKLKCDQATTSSGTGKCSRCVKSNTECSTSAPRPSGRPSRQQQRKQIKSRKPDQLWGFENTPLQNDDPTPLSTTVTTLSVPFEESAMQFDIFDDSMFASFTAEDFSFSHTLPTANKELSSTFWDGTRQNIVSDMPTSELDLYTDGVTDHWSRKGLQPHLLISRDRSYHLKTLAELNSTLFQHLSVIDKLVYGDCCKVDPNLGVKTMLNFLQEFAKIISYFLMFSPITSAPRLTSSFDASNEDEMGSNDSDVDFEERTFIQHDTDGCQADLDNDASFNSEKTARNTGTANGPLIDYPTILALTTCYVSLIRLHRTAFNRIRLSLQVASKKKVVPQYKDLPPLLPGLDLAGYPLGMNRSIQITVFMHVVLDLFWRAEKGITAIAAAERNGIATSTSGHMELLKTMLKQEAATAGRSTQMVKDKAVGRNSLKTLAREIRALCRGHVCLQLEESTVATETFSANF